MLIDSRRHNGPTLQARLARSLALLVLLLTAAARPALAAPIAFVQSNSATPQSPQTTVTVTYTAAQTLGNLNVVVVGWNNSTAAVSSVTDSRGNAYAVAAAPVVQSGTASQVIYYAKNISAAGAGANTVTVTFSTAAAFPDIRIAEYSGLDTVSPLDVSVGAQGTTTSTSNSGAVTTTNANDLLVGANLVQSITTGAGTGFTSRGITADGDILEDRIVTVTGSYNATAALDKVQAWIMQMVAFRAAGSGTPAPSITSLNPTSGLVGASVTITGANFGASQGTSTVTFNGNSNTHVMERHEHHDSGSHRCDDRQRCRDGRRGRQQRRELHRCKCFSYSFRANQFRKPPGHANAGNGHIYRRAVGGQFKRRDRQLE